MREKAGIPCFGGAPLPVIGWILTWTVNVYFASIQSTHTFFVMAASCSASAAALAPPRRSLLSFVEELPAALKSRVFCFLPIPAFVAELKRSLDICVWCRMAFHHDSGEHARFQLWSIEGGAVGGQVFYVCAGCLDRDVKCNTWLFRELRAYRNSFALGPPFYSWTGTEVFDSVAALRDHLIAHRPKSVLDALEDLGFRTDCFFYLERYYINQYEDFTGFGSSTVEHMMGMASLHWEDNMKFMCDCGRCQLPTPWEPPRIRSKAPVLSTERVIFMYGWDPVMWPEWVRSHFPEVLIAGNYWPTYETPREVGSGPTRTIMSKRIRRADTRCLLKLEIDTVPPAFRVLRRKRDELLSSV